MSSWQEIEKNICKTKIFLKRNLVSSPFRQEDQIKCSDCILRYISILVVSGKVKVAKISASNNLWFPHETFSDSRAKPHGSDWHDGMINKINNYFLLKKYFTEKEPNLHYGKADIGILDLNIYIEVGTVNFYKLLINSIKMNNCLIIIVPNDHYIIEFSL